MSSENIIDEMNQSLDEQLPESVSSSDSETVTSDTVESSETVSSTDNDDNIQVDEKTMDSSILDEPIATEEQPVAENDIPEQSACPEAEPLVDLPTTTNSSEQLAVLEQLHKKVDSLYNLFEQRLSYDEHKDVVNDRQYEELVAFRSGLLEKLQKPIFQDIIAEIDDAVKLEEHYKNAEFNEENFHKLLKLFLDFSSNLCDLLERHDVLAFQTNPGEKFDPKTQTAQKKRFTDNPDLQGVISKSLRYGFKLQDKILRREMVEVYIYKKPEPVVVKEPVTETDVTQQTEVPAEA